MSDDELRRRLHDIPAPGAGRAGAGLDADAVVAGAKRRRRPKTIALSSAATVAGVLIVAPLVVPGLGMLQPTGMSSVSSDSGAAESAEQPVEEAAPGAEAPRDEDQGGGADGQETTGSEDAGTGDSGASGDAGTGAPDGPSHALDPTLAWCGMRAAGDAGLALTMLEAPVMNGPGSGVVQVEVTNTGAAPITLEVAPVIAIEVGSPSGGSIVGGEAESLTLSPGESAVLDEPTAVLPAGVCADRTPSADVPTAIVGRDGAEPIAVVGSPWE